jgi:hypothetical protein
VIDLTDCRFAVADDPQSLAARNDAFVAWDRKNRRMPSFVTRFLLRAARRRSRLLQAMFESQESYLDSISTYMMKLGADNLPAGFDGPMDRKIAAAPHVVLLRLRMQQIAKLLAEALVEPLQSQSTAPLHLINIAGGPALDSINTVLLLWRSHEALLRRPIAIHVLDSRSEGPAFGRNALAALSAADGPLHGLDIAFTHQPYDWNDRTPLAQLARDLDAQHAIVAVSSEGGLFEYGDDDAIVGNLRTLSDARVPLVAGSVTSASDIRKRMLAQTKFRLFPRGIEGFAPLAQQGGYVIAERRPAIMSDQVLLRLAAEG